MHRHHPDTIIRDIMLEYARATGLRPASPAPRRYLWTDAFAVCTFLELYRTTQDPTLRDLALSLVGQVHDVLGRHRADDFRSGRLGMLDENEGVLHPTSGGLRIGKRLNERRPGEPADERTEWDRDGQYFHYLTKWMHALNRVSQVTGDRTYAAWAVELAATVHNCFTYLPPGGKTKRIYWKMSIDLRRPLVPSMGQHDPLDGLLTYSELRTAGDDLLSVWPGIDDGITDMAAICREMAWATDDPLGLGGLLADAWRMAQLLDRGAFRDTSLLETVLESAVDGLRSLATDTPLKYRAALRLPFRELGLAIGLKAVSKLQGWVAQNLHRFGNESHLQRQVNGLTGYLPLADVIERFWQDGKNREATTWVEHRDINMVMLATSLAPGEFLTV